MSTGFLRSRSRKKGKAPADFDDALGLGLGGRKPIVGSRTVEWHVSSGADADASGQAHRRGGSNSTTNELATPRNNNRMRSSSRQIDHVSPWAGSMAGSRRGVGHSRQASAATDTTQRTIASDRRSIRLTRRSIFSSKPKLELELGPQSYTRDRDGNLPTMRPSRASRSHRSIFVDDIADDLTTQELRDAMTRDDRRRRTRSTRLLANEMRGLRDKGDGEDGVVMRTGGGTIVRYVGGDMANENRFHDVTDGDQADTSLTESALTPDGTPVHDHFMARKSQALVTGRGDRGKVNAITGRQADWQEAETRAINELYPVNGGNAPPALGALVVLSGNRESFPDFATTEQTRKAAARSSNGSAFLSNAWTSLWRRAGSTRARKERDLAKHQLAIVAPSIEPHSEAGDVQHTDDLTPVQSPVDGARETSSADVPSDAFYDPTGPRLTSATNTAGHSRNFSRRINDHRRDDSLAMDNGRLDVIPDRTTTLTPVVSSPVGPIDEQQAFSSPEAAAGLIADASPVLPMSAEQSRAMAAQRVPISAALFTSSESQGTQGAQHRPSSSSRMRIDALKSGGGEAMAGDRASVHSLQSIESNNGGRGGPWLANRNSEYDQIVRRSFSRLNDGRPGSALSGGSSGGGVAGVKKGDAPTRAASLQRRSTALGQVIIPDDLAREMADVEDEDVDISDDESELEALLAPAAPGNTTGAAIERSDVIRAEPASPTSDRRTTLSSDFGDDPALADIGQGVGVWRTALGKPVQIVSRAIPSAATDAQYETHGTHAIEDGHVAAVVAESPELRPTRPSAPSAGGDLPPVAAPPGAHVDTSGHGHGDGHSNSVQTDVHAVQAMHLAAMRGAHADASSAAIVAEAGAEAGAEDGERSETLSPLPTPGFRANNPYSLASPHARALLGFKRADTAMSTGGESVMSNDSFVTAQPFATTSRLQLPQDERSK